MYIIGNSLCEHGNVGGKHPFEEGEGCNVHLYNANSSCFDCLSVLFIGNFEFPAGIYLVGYE